MLPFPARLYWSKEAGSKRAEAFMNEHNYVPPRNFCFLVPRTPVRQEEAPGVIDPNDWETDGRLVVTQ